LEENNDVSLEGGALRRIRGFRNDAIFASERAMADQKRNRGRAIWAKRGG